MISERVSREEMLRQNREMFGDRPRVQIETDRRGLDWFLDPFRFPYRGRNYVVPRLPFPEGSKVYGVQLKLSEAMDEFGNLRDESEDMESREAASPARVERMKDAYAIQAEAMKEGRQLIWRNTLAEQRGTGKVAAFDNWRRRRTHKKRNPWASCTVAELVQGLNFLLLSQRIEPGRCQGETTG